LDSDLFLDQLELRERRKRVGERDMHPDGKFTKSLGKEGGKKRKEMTSGLCPSPAN